MSRENHSRGESAGKKGAKCLFSPIPVLKAWWKSKKRIKVLKRLGKTLEKEIPIELPPGDISTILLDQLCQNYLAQHVHPELGASMEAMRGAMTKALRMRGYKLVQEQKDFTIRTTLYFEAPDQVNWSQDVRQSSTV